MPNAQSQTSLAVWAARPGIHQAANTSTVPPGLYAGRRAGVARPFPTTQQATPQPDRWPADGANTQAAR